MSQTNVNAEPTVKVVPADQKTEETVQENPNKKEAHVTEKPESEIDVAAVEEQSEEGEESDGEESVSTQDHTTEADYEEEAYHGEEEESPGSSTESEEEDKFATQVEYVKRKKLPKAVKDFFKDFHKMPDINKLRLDESLVGEDAGGMIDLEGDVKDEEEQSVVDLSLMEEEHTASSRYSDFEFEFYSSEDEKMEGVKKKKVSDENLFETLVRMDTKPEIIQDEPDLDEIERLRIERFIKTDTKHFMEQLIQLVVETAEYVDPKQILRESLNKVLLFRQLLTALHNMYVESRVNDEAKRKCTNYYRRQKKLRYIRPDDPNQLENEIKRYEETVAELDYQLGKEVATEEAIKKRTTVAEQETKRMEKALKKEISDLVIYIKKTLSHRGTERFAQFVEARLAEMARLRREISKIRQVFIGVQHENGILLDKISEIDNIGDGLELHNYEILQNEVLILEKKLEERSIDLVRQRAHFGVQINSMAHMREKETIVYHAMKTQKEALYRAIDIKDSLRVCIHKLKVKRVRMKKKIYELNFQSGLIDKPALCLDFCATEDRCIELKRTNGEKEEKLSKMQIKLEACERKLAA